MAKFIKLEWWNTCDIDNILYQTGYKQHLYLDCDLGSPEYKLKQEFNTNGDETNLPKFQRWDKIYKFYFYAPEYIADCLSLLPLHDNVWIYTQNEEICKCEDVIVEVAWEEPCFAKISIQFSQDYIIKTNCCRNIGAIECLDVTVPPVISVEHWDHAVITDPLNNGVVDGDSYLIIDSVTAIGNIYKFSTVTNSWELRDGLTGNAVNDIVYVTGSAVNYINTNLLIGGGIASWSVYPLLLTANNDGTTVILTGFTLQDTFIQAQSNCSGSWENIGNPILSNEFNADGISITISLDVACEFRFHCYTHNCDYGYSNGLRGT